MNTKQELLRLATKTSSLAQELAALLPDETINLAATNKATNGEGLWQSHSIDLEKTKNSLSDVLLSLQTFVKGPLAIHRDWFGSHYDLMALHVLLEFGVLQKIPQDGTIDLTSLSQDVDLDPEKLERMLHLLSTQGYVDEPEHNTFKHTFSSKILAADDLLQSQAKLQLGTLHKVTVAAVDYFQEMHRIESSSPSSIEDRTALRKDRVPSPFEFRYGSPLYVWLKAKPDQAANFAKAMKGIQRTDRPGTVLDQWIKGNDENRGVLVDVGGGSGHISLDLAHRHPHWDFVVQDQDANMFNHTKASLPEDMRDRIIFQQHNFFEPQPIRTGIRGWILRQVLHNWDDESAAKILRNFVPAMEADPRLSILINETVIPRKGEITMIEERRMRQIDLALFITTNGKLRTMEDWDHVLSTADSRLQLKRTIIDQSTMAVLEVRLEDRMTR